MDRQMFQDVSHAELCSVEGGLSFSGFLKGIKSAACWVGEHVSVGFKDMAGAAAKVLKFSFHF
jgi:hypothetical protein